MSHLRALPQLHDLPPMWDGEKVTWDAWKIDRSTFIFHAPVEDLACESCGVIDSGMYAFGTREGSRARDLMAERCTHCTVDTVADLRTGETWTLDATDYGDAGSEDIKETLW